MSENKLKKALNYVINQEINQYPDDSTLAQKYSFSQHFESGIDSLIKWVKDKYIIIGGKAISRNIAAVLLSCIALCFFLFLYISDTISLSTTRLLFSVFELFLLFIFGSNLRGSARYMTGSYKTAFIDTDEEKSYDGLLFDLQYPLTGPVKDMEYIIPKPPVQYKKTKEYRTVTEHTVEFSDGLGRTINYACYEIYAGVLNRIKPENAQINKITINNMEGTSFTKNGIVHIVWADKHYLYHLYGNCKQQLLIDMAENMQ